jgi:SAM-dependent methyltransferase
MELELKSYYYAHELAYQQIKSKGYVGWGNASSLAALGDEKTNEYLNRILKKCFPDPIGKFALDLGCGTGTTAFVMSKLGFETTGIDISETAIELGKDLMRQQNLKIEFVVGDILNPNCLNKKFNLIYDSHVLHCIVFEEDRRKVFNEIRNLLSSGGFFILDTMVLPEGNVSLTLIPEELRFDQDFILWHKVKPSTDRGVVEFEGQHWCAQRRVYPIEVVMNEINEAGFQVLEEQIDTQLGEPSMLRLVLKLAA